MATAPNMNVAPLVPQVGLPPAVEGEGGDPFASLLSIATGVPADSQIVPAAAPGQVTSGGTTAGAPIMPGVVPDEGLTIDFHAATPKGEGGETDGSDPTDPVETSSLLPEADFLPILQAQTGFPVTVTTVSIPTPQVPEIAASSTQQIPAQPAAPSRPPVETAPQLPIAGPSLAEGEPASQDPAIAVAVRQLVQGLKGQQPDAGTDQPASKEAPKGGHVQPVKALAEPPAVGTGKEAMTERSAPAEKAAASAPAPVQVAPVVQVSPIPAAITPVVAMVDPTASLQPARAEAGAPQPMPGADAAITRELDLAHESEWLDRLARDIARTGSNDGPMRFKLNPNTLGHLQVELSQGDRGTSIRLTVETEAARTILTDAQPRLLAEARAQGVRIAQSEIDLSGNGHQASGDPRRHQEDARQTVLIRTARGPDGEAAAAVAPARTRADRYA